MFEITSILFEWISPIAFILIFGAIGCGLIIGREIQPRAKNQVTYLQSKTRIGFDLDITDESALILECEDIKGMPHKRFLKFRPGFDIKKGRRHNKIITRYFGIEGSAFTTRLENGITKNITPSDYLKVLWGEKIYEAMDPSHKNKIENATVPITISLDNEINKITNPISGELETIPEDDYFRALGEQIPGIIAEGVEGVNRAPIIDKIMYVGTGFGIACVCFILKVLTI